MFDAFSVGATGMQAQQLNVETIANNIANANTVGFKKARVGFTDLMVREGMRVAQPGAEELRAGALAPAGMTSAGVGIASVAKVFEQGDLKKTDAPLDIAIQGDGFLEVSMADGFSAYTRGGSLKVNKDGLLVMPSGNPLKPEIRIPDNAQTITIAADGTVSVRAGNQATAVVAGQLQLVRFTNPAGLLANGDNLYRATDSSGEAITARAGEDGTGTIAQGSLESSNVKMVDEMVNLMLAQRAYESSLKVVQAADEMYGMVNNLRK
jgi:flagellar basal-body rod protein FlgG